jgi:hypothetical protein
MPPEGDPVRSAFVRACAGGQDQPTTSATRRALIGRNRLEATKSTASSTPFPAYSIPDKIPKLKAEGTPKKKTTTAVFAVARGRDHPVTRRIKATGR